MILCVGMAIEGLESLCNGTGSIVLTIGLSLKVTFLGAFLEVFVGLEGCELRRGICSEEEVALVSAMGKVD